MEQACPMCPSLACTGREPVWRGATGAPGGPQPKPRRCVMCHCCYGNTWLGRHGSMCKERNWILSNFSSGFPCWCELPIHMGLPFHAAKMLAPHCRHRMPWQARESHAEMIFAGTSEKVLILHLALTALSAGETGSKLWIRRFSSLSCGEEETLPKCGWKRMEPVVPLVGYR